VDALTPLYARSFEGINEWDRSKTPLLCRESQVSEC
jgi:hypothetical protein